MARLKECFDKINTPPKSEQLTALVHHLALHTNNYQQFGALATKMAMTYKKGREYSLNQVEALYLQVKHGKNTMPQLLDMAEMFALKYEKDGHLKSQAQQSEGAD
mmetsp:Transcript_8641/g.14631  ORF Transcript_8641/g.14631 Transcript_8641/m.14631 type:complete len:105 (+) Transcript_8641:348-662(+)